MRVDPVRHSAQSNPDTLALYDAASTYRETYRELDARVSRVARGLMNEGVERKDRIGILGGIEPAVAHLIHGCFRIGAIPVLLDPTIGSDRVHARCEAVGVSWAFRTPSVDDVPHTTRSKDVIPSVSEADGVSPVRHDADDTAAILFTSGTTGSPDAVPLTWKNLFTNAMGSALRLGIQPEDRWLVCLKPYHMGGFAPYIRAAQSGTGVVSSQPGTASLATSIDETGATGVSLVPPLLERCLEDEVPLDVLRTVLVGGDRTDPHLVRRALDANIPIYCSYGMTEAASQITTAPPHVLRETPGTVGHPLQWVNLDIVDASGAAVPAGESGELIVRGPTVTPGYIGESDEDRVTETGALRTGDEGKRDESGKLYITGRTRDRIITGGATVDPRSIASVLESHDAVDTAAVIGVPDEEWGERVGALLQLHNTESVDDILAAVSDRLSSAERPRTVETVDEMPRTASGTIDRPNVRRILKTHGT